MQRDPRNRQVGSPVRGTPTLGPGSSVPPRRRRERPRPRIPRERRARAAQTDFIWVIVSVALIFVAAWFIE